MSKRPPLIKAGKHLSLQIKVGVVISVVLVILIFTMTWLHQHSLEEQFQQHLSQTLGHNSDQLQALLNREQEDLLRLGTLTAALANEDLDKFPEILKQHWPTLEFDWDFDALRYFSIEGELLFTGGRLQLPQDITGWLQQVRETEQPMKILDCQAGCLEYAIIPLLAGENMGGILVLSHTLADLIINFSTTSHTASGILTSVSPSDTASDKRLNEWQLSVAVLARPEINLPLLEKFSQSSSINDAIETGVQLAIDKHTYYLQLIPLNDAQHSNPIYAVLINDISNGLARIKEETRQSFLTGVLGLFTALLLLMLSLRMPMQRLKRLANTLPLLAQHAYKPFRERLKTNNSGHVEDEIDVVNNTALQLASELETLQGEVIRHADILTLRSDELARERDFVTHLLDSVQVIIVTQDKDGRIRLLNRTGETLTGHTEEALIGKTFREVFLNPDITASVHHSLQQIRDGKRASYQHEAVLSRRDGIQSEISWLHTHLHNSPVDATAMISVGLDISDRIEAEKRLAWLADHDPLTSLYNRRRFQNEFETAIQLALRYQRPGALLYLDLDEFKLVNDTQGHHAGDELLQEVSEKLRNLVRHSDIVARLGGDEFAIVMREADQRSAATIATEIIHALNKLERLAKNRHTISASIGIVLFPEHGDDVHSLLANADLAMYRAKETGKGRWHLFQTDDQSRERIHRKAYWKDRIKDALENDKFELFYQPILEIGNQQVSHFEVLLRMQDDMGGVLPPGVFIGVAEEIGLIHSIDHWVLRQALRKQAEFHRQNIDITLSINLSGVVIDDPHLLPLLRSELSRSGVNPEKIVFELTETSAVADIAAAIQLMHEVRDLGCRFALDDFGVGFSSFSYLKQLPLDFVKIDGSFIRQLPDNVDDQLFVKALTDVARGMGKKTIAEFVEDAQTLEMLRDYGVDYAQGYYIGKPQPEINPNRIIHTELLD